MGKTIAAVVGVCDECELILACVEHLESQRVSSIVVVDNNSSDGTAEILRALKRAGRIALIETPGNPVESADYFRRGIAYAKELFAPEWIIVQDADEFWVHASGDLTAGIESFAEEAFTVERFNACICEPLCDLGPDVSLDVEALRIFVEPLRLSRVAMNEDSGLRWIAAQPAKKVVAPARLLLDVSAGGHVALGHDGHPIRMRETPDLLIVHIPFSSYGRFKRKVENARALVTAFEGFFPGETAWHWKRWIALLDDGQLEAEFARQTMAPDALASLQVSGAVQTVTAYMGQRTGFAPGQSDVA